MSCFIMAATSPLRKKQNKCVKKIKECCSNDTKDVLEDVNQIIEETLCHDENIDGKVNLGSDENHKKDGFEFLSLNKCIECHCQLTPERTNDSTSDSLPPQVLRWFCSKCKKIIEREKDSSNCSVTLKVTATNDKENGSTTLLSTTTTITSTSIATQTSNSSSGSSSNPSTCSCSICKKHNHGNNHEDLKACWNQLKLAILKIYRDSGLVLSQVFLQQTKLDSSLLSQQNNSKILLPNNERLKEIVHRLCIHDRHKLYQCLEAQVRLFVVEMRLNLLKHLENGSQALFEAMTDQYQKLCRASKKSAQFLQELESKHLRKFNLTWEFLNRRLFQSTVYCDTFIKHGLPKLTALTKDRSLIDMYARFLKFEDEMTVISVVWREAQQFIDKYEKYAVLNKKKALLKEWEQFSVEWVLEDQYSGKGKPNGDSPKCIKKPSIECLNARFLEEQKMLKSGKNMQSVNIAAETQSALQEQLLLSAYGEWDSNDNQKSLYNYNSSSNSMGKELTPTQVDALLEFLNNKHGKNKNDIKTDIKTDLKQILIDHEVDEDGDEDEDDEDDVDDDDEDDEDDSCSDDQSSTTSTSTSNNQRGEGRVCDCCYCEVFGHGMPPVAPTSRNYNEMRERLRMRLSKRKAEKCEKNAGLTVHETTVKSKDNEIKHEDQRDLEELINYIEGTGNPGDKKKKKEKAKKKKEKKKDEKKEEVKKEKESKSIINYNSKTNKSSETIKDHKQMKDLNSHSNEENIDMNNVKHESSTKLTNGFVENSSLLTVNGMHLNGKHSNKITNGNNNNNNKKKVKSNDKKDQEQNANHDKIKHQQQHQQQQVQQQQNPSYTICHPKTVILNNVHNGGVPLISNQKSNGNLIQNNKQFSHSPEIIINETKNGKAKQNKLPKNKKKNADETLSPEEVFMPKDIDLDNDELDDFEKELEKFKRFCFDSVPLPQKEKVNVNLKDFIIKKRND